MKDQNSWLKDQNSHDDFNRDNIMTFLTSTKVKFAKFYLGWPKIGIGKSLACTNKFVMTDVGPIHWLALVQNFWCFDVWMFTTCGASP